jgi:type II secretory pathway pseudopilin PulG
VEIMIVVAIIGLLSTLCIPNLIQSRKSGRIRLCIDNLRQIDGIKQQWAIEHNMPTDKTPLTSEIQPYMGRGSGGMLPYCPQDEAKSFSTSYVINDLSTPPTCKMEPETHVFLH